MVCKKFLYLALMAAAVSACSNKDSAKVASAVDDDYLNAYRALESARTPTSRVSGDTVSASEGVWLGSRSVLIPHKNDLPAKFETSTGVTIINNEPVNLSELANIVKEATGIPVVIDGQIGSDKLNNKVRIEHSGRLSDLLSKAAMDMDLLWYYDRQSIVFYQTETKTFNLNALGTDISVSSRIQTDDSNQVALESNMREWEEIEKSISAILDGVNNAKFTVSRSLGTITVTAAPSVLARVSDYVARQNRRLSQQISIDVKVLQVSISNANAFGLNLGAAIQSTSGLQLVSRPGGNPEISGANALNLAVLNNDVAGAAGGSLSGSAVANSPFGPAAGSAALIQALAKQGKISLVTNVSVTTRNNRVAPVSNVKTQGYIKKFETRSFTADVTSTVEQDTLETGFSMQLLPSILEGGRVLLLFKMSLRELINLEDKKVGNIFLQLPEVEERAFMQEVVMESGQMLVLSGFEKQTNNDTRYGTGDPGFMALGGSRDTQSKKDVLVVILTPQVHVSPMDAERAIQREWGAPLN